MTKPPVDYDIVRSGILESGISSFGTASIREIVKLVNQLEKSTGKKYIRMEMGVPGLKAPEIGIEAEIKALKKGVAAVYPDIEGVAPLKEETSRFVKLFLDLDIKPQNCIPAVGSMMGSMASFLVANRTDKNKGSTLFIDPGFPVHKQQVKMLGQEYYSFDVFNYRGSKLKAKLESYLESGKISSVLYSNPNNPSWICLNEEELAIIGELSVKYDFIVIEDLAYLGMDFRKDYYVPGKPPFQPTIGRYTDNYIILVSSSKIFSYAGQRIGMMVISDGLFTRRYPDLLQYYSSDTFGHSVIFGALYGLSTGVSHSAQFGLAALLKAANDGSYKFFDALKEYKDKAEIMKDIFTRYGFGIVYDNDLGEPVADGFYFTISYPGMTSGQLLESLLYYGISAISLEITGSNNSNGLRACVSNVSREQFDDLVSRLRCFREDHLVTNNKV